MSLRVPGLEHQAVPLLAGADRKLPGEDLGAADGSHRDPRQRATGERRSVVGRWCLIAAHQRRDVRDGVRGERDSGATLRR